MQSLCSETNKDYELGKVLLQNQEGNYSEPLRATWQKFSAGAEILTFLQNLFEKGATVAQRVKC